MLCSSCTAEISSNFSAVCSVQVVLLKYALPLVQCAQWWSPWLQSMWLILTPRYIYTLYSTCSSYYIISLKTAQKVEFAIKQTIPFGMTTASLSHSKAYVGCGTLKNENCLWRVPSSVHLYKRLTFSTTWWPLSSFCQGLSEKFPLQTGVLKLKVFQISKRTRPMLGRPVNFFIC